MSKKSKRQFGTDSPDPRTKRAEAVRVGDKLKGARVTHVKRERKGGREGLRIRLSDGRRTWARHDAPIHDAVFERPLTSKHPTGPQRLPSGRDRAMG